MLARAIIFVTMSKHIKLLGGLFVVFAVLGAAVWFLRDANFAVLQPKGTIGQEQKELLLFGTFLSIFVVVPVFALLIWISIKYREQNNHTDYEPEWDHSKKFELIWWGVPIFLIAILSVVTWRSSHALDPFRPLDSDKRPLTIEVVALQWRWLFIYPEQNIATINAVQIPVNQPVQFKITSDAPMNSFWIPELGGQIYAMSGMSTQLHLMATEPGTYKGLSSNISGTGFADMKFAVTGGSESDFNRWVDTVKQSPESLTQEAYEKLAEPSNDSSVKTYGDVDADLYDTIVMKYMLHTGGEHLHGVNHD